jgi:hypothetical protein
VGEAATKKATSAKYQEIVWLSSYPKSGNTWLRLFFDAYIMGEVDINEVVTSVADDNAKRHTIGDQTTDIRRLPIDVQQLARPMALLRLVLAFQQNRIANVPLLVKTHNPNLVSNGIELLPAHLTKQTIYIVRDPRDVAPSFAKHTGVDVDKAITSMSNRYNVLQDEDKSSNRVADLLSSWDNHVNSYRTGDAHNTKIYRYEDMREKPERTFRQIIEQVGLPFDHERMQKALELTDLERLRSVEKEQGFKESSPHAKDQFFGEGRGRHKLTIRQRKRIEKDMGRQMKALGYL